MSMSTAALVSEMSQASEFLIQCVGRSGPLSADTAAAVVRSLVAKMRLLCDLDYAGCNRITESAAALRSRSAITEAQEKDLL